MNFAPQILPTVFDSSLAAYPTRVIPTHQVKDLLSVTHAVDRIEDYRNSMAQGHRFPPVSVISVAGRWIIADGHKRFNAYRTFGSPCILVEVWTIRRFLLDQWIQILSNLRKNCTIVVTAFQNRREAVRLLMATVGHWRRVALSLGACFKTQLPKSKSDRGASR